MGVNNFTLNYNQMGLIATVELSDVYQYMFFHYIFILINIMVFFFHLQCEENHVAWQRFLPNGVIALLPLSSNLSSIVWSTDTKNVKNLLQLPDIEFTDAVNQAFVSDLYIDRQHSLHFLVNIPFSCHILPSC